MKLFEYSTNNSGGDWWLTKENWENLEKNGWRVIWCDRERPTYDNGKLKWDANGFPKTEQVPDKMYAGWCIAHYAYKYFISHEEAVEDFERWSGQDYEEKGCPCCGNPHSIYEERIPS